MTQFLKKNAKLFHILFAVYAFLFVIISCVYMTTYSRIAVDYTVDFLTTGRPTILTGLNTFCNRTGYDYATMYGTMFDSNVLLQQANNMILYLGVVSLVMVAIMFICTNATRKKYYISNLVSGIVCPAVCIVMALVTIVFNVICIGDINTNYDILNWGSLANSDYYNRAADQFLAGDTSSFGVSIVPIVIYIVIMALFIVASGAMIAYAVFRYLDTRKELANTSDETTVDSADQTPEDDTEVKLSERMVEANV